MLNSVILLNFKVSDFTEKVEVESSQLSGGRRQRSGATKGSQT